ncbi:hypothetical protein Peur_046979 [Populus x canadensis]
MGLDSDRNPCPHFQVSVSGGLDLVPSVAGSRLIKSWRGRKLPLLSRAASQITIHSKIALCIYMDDWMET